MPLHEGRYLTSRSGGCIGKRHTAGRRPLSGPCCPTSGERNDEARGLGGLVVDVANDADEGLDDVAERAFGGCLEHDVTALASSEVDDGDGEAHAPQ
jgi:hypothetical protein